MKILVTGGAGFIGSHLTKALLKRKDKVIVLDNFDPLYSVRVKRENMLKFKNDKNFVLIEGDITNTKVLERVFKKHKIDKVVHLAALASPPVSMKEPLNYVNVNYYGTVSLLEVAAKNKIKNFVFASTSAIYGGSTKVPFKETDNLSSPISQYAATKGAGELICYTYHHIYNIPITCLRFFTIYGPNQRPYGMAHQKFIKLMFRGKPLPVYGDGSMARDYVYVEDVVQAILKSLDKNTPFGVFNIGSSSTVSLTEMIQAIEKAMGKKAKINNLPIPKTEVPITYADITRAKKVLGFCPKTSLEEGVKKQVEFFLNAPDWYKDLPI
ncbi:MAG: GDP-mannose 4,6-dehydratase [bacterium]